MHLAQALLTALKDHGAREIFGIPGDFVLSFFKVIEESGILPLYTLSHEPSLGFAADASARFNRSLGVVSVTYGAGAFQMTGWELGNCRRYGWSPIVLLFNNTGWGMLREFESHTKFNELGDWHFAEMAGPLGGTGERVTTRAELQAALGRAVQRSGQFHLIEIMVKPGTTSETLARYAKGFKSQGRRAGN